MGFFDIIILGWGLNLLASLIFTISIIILILKDKDKSTIGLLNLQSKILELNNLRKDTNFFKRHKETIIFIMPFANILYIIRLFDKIRRIGLLAYYENEIENIKRFK